MATPDLSDKPRGGNGAYRADLEVAERDGQAAIMFCQGATLDTIAKELGYASRTNAQRAIDRAYAERRSPPELRLARATRLAELNEARAEAWAVALDPPPLVDRLGRVVHDDDGNVVPDRQAWTSAMQIILRAAEITAKIEGLNAPKRTHATIEGVLASISPADLSAYIQQRSKELGVDQSPAARRRMLEQALAELDAEERRAAAIPALAESA